MNVKTWLPLCLAIVLGLVAAKFARDMMAKNNSGENTSGKLVQVVIAKQSVGAGEALTPENCQLGNVGADTVPEGSFRSITELKDRVAQLQLAKGQPVTETVLAPVGSGTGLQVLIPTGMRAITIEVNEFSGVGGMLLPGCHVDVLATVPAEQHGEMLARTVVQNVTVTAVGQQMISQPQKKGDEPVVFRSVTLLVTPSEAEAIELAASSGRPRLVLRSGTDKNLSITAGVTSSALRGMPPVKRIDPVPTSNPVIVPTPQPIYTTVKVIRGTVESEVRMDGSWFSSNPAVTNTDTKTVSDAGTAPAVDGNR